MFCKYCGAEVPNDAVFCPSCGCKSGAGTTSAPTGTGITETIIVEVQKEDETVTINRYTKFGWVLKNNQEVNVTSIHGGGSTVNGNGGTVITSSTKTYIKLTFERSTGMANFAILDGFYQKFKKCRKETNDINYNISEPLSVKQQVRTVLLWSAILLFPFTMLIGNAIFYETPFLFGEPEAFFSFYRLTQDSATFIASLGCGFFCAGMSALLVLLGVLSYAKGKARKHYAPRLAELEHEMDFLANEAAKYL